jgi:hypothetical protein
MTPGRGVVALLIDLAHREPVAALHATSEGMTDSPHLRGLSTTGAPALETHPTRTPTATEPHRLTFSASNSMRRTASASRTYGRFAVGPSRARSWTPMPYSTLPKNRRRTNKKRSTTRTGG